MKKKILSLCLVAVLALTAIGGATLAYFTDTAEDVNNTFTIGNIDIELYELTAIYDGKDYDIKLSDVTKNANGQTVYESVMPTYYLQKEAFIKNNGKNEAYVRVFVTINNYKAIEAAFADYEDAQAKYDDVFDKFDIECAADSIHTLSGWMNKPIGTATDGIKLLAIDYVTNNDSYQADENNTFADADYYAGAVESDSRTYVLYFKIAAGKSYNLFHGLNVPADFDAEQMKMFDGLEIGVYADAIQTVGFHDTVVKDADGEMTGEYVDAWVNAIKALESDHHMGWWISEE